MTAFTQGEVYQTDFDPKAYLKDHFTFGRDRDAILNFRLQQYSKTFKSGGITGHTLIDIGAGPSILQILSACEVFEEIIVSDYTDANRLELEKWLKNEPGAFDWSPAVKAACELEGNGERWLKKEEKVRQTVKRVLRCDVMQTNPLEPVVLPEVDCVVTSLCLESACKDYEAYCSALKNIASLLKTGGHLVIVGALGCKYYKVGQQVFFSLEMDEELVRKAITREGYVIKEMEILFLTKDDAGRYAHFFLVAHKEKTK